MNVIEISEEKIQAVFAEVARDQQDFERAGSIVCAIYFDYGRSLAWWVRDPSKPMRFDLAWPADFKIVGAA